MTQNDPHQTWARSCNCHMTRGVVDNIPNIESLTTKYYT